MTAGRRFAILCAALAMTTGLMAGCGADGESTATTTTAAPKAAPATTEAPESDDAAEEAEGLGAFDDDCYIDEDGHGPDCDEVEVDDDCFIDADGHGPDCDQETVGQPVDDCYIDEDGHGPDCDQETVNVPAGDCYIDEDGHGPDCDQEGLGGPEDLRYLSGWDVDGSELDVGTVFTLTCEPNGKPGEVWGTDPYSDESSLCTAAVHAGRITVKKGGTVGGQRIDSRRTMPGGKANGINSKPADNWRGAIEFF
ncbi:MAG: LCCL domain-containing protein [Aquihabitans sp.]